MKILYLGVVAGTSLHRKTALERLGHKVRMIDPEANLPRDYLRAKLRYESGALLSERFVAKDVLSQLGNESYDLVWVDHGRCVGPALIQGLQRRAGAVLNLNVDDPYGWRDRLSWLLYRKAVRHYDLVVVVRKPNLEEARALGARNTMWVWRAADEVAHAPRTPTAEERERYASEVVFVGTYFPERGPFFAELIERGVPLAIYGDHWQKAREWPLLEHCWRGPSSKNDDEYALMLQCSKVALGMLSKGNRDLHTTRTAEVPHLGAAFCAERTPEHDALYLDGKEALFWDDAAECAHQCRVLLADAALRRSVAAAGRARCLANGTLNEVVAEQVLERAAQIATGSRVAA
jgi:spore maturation protein CgeB